MTNAPSRTPPLRGRRHRDVGALDPAPPHPPDRAGHRRRRPDRRPVEHARAVALAVAAGRPAEGARPRPRPAARRADAALGADRARRPARRRGVHRPQRRLRRRRSSSARRAREHVALRLDPAALHVAPVAPARSRSRRCHTASATSASATASRSIARTTRCRTHSRRRRCSPICSPNTASTPTRRSPRSTTRRGSGPATRAAAGAAELRVVGGFHDLGPVTEPHQHTFEPAVARHGQAGRDPALFVGLTDVVDRVGLDHPPRRRRQTKRHAWHPTVEEPASRLREWFVGRLADLTGRLERLDAVDPERAQRRRCGGRWR